MQAEIAGRARHAFVNGRNVRILVGWIRDDSYVYQAARYWDSEARSCAEMFLDMQRPNGMIYDFINRGGHVDPYTGRKVDTYLRQSQWGDEWAGKTDDLRWYFARVPVEADVEYLLVQEYYEAWQASGDDGWMARALPGLEKAINYSMSDPMRWDAEHGVVKRGFTIDTWDFQHRCVAEAHPNGNTNHFGQWDFMWIDQDTPMGVLHGDNSGVYQACRQLAKMNAHLGRDEKATEWNARAEELKRAANELCWNGRFYTHHVDLDPLPRELGVDEAEQLSFSNPHDVNRGLADHEQAVSIVREYMSRREANPDHLAEWYTIDPPYPDLWNNLQPGDYMNGGITPIVAGELALAAFEHGHEAYGADILRRVAELHEEHGHLHATYHPKARQPDWVECDYETVDLRGAANAPLSGETPCDLHQFPADARRMCAVPFDLVAPESNDGRAAVIVGQAHGFAFPDQVTVDGIGAQARSLYFLHCSAGGRRDESVAAYELTYADGSTASVEVCEGDQIVGWWEFKGGPNWRRAWMGTDERGVGVQVGCFGWENPHPEREIRSIAFRATGQGAATVLGVTLSSGPVQFEWGWISHGIPDHWAAASVYRTAVQGLVGVKDNHKLFEDCTVAPRWPAMAEDQAEAVVRYGPSDSYVAYRYRHRPEEGTIHLELTGSGERFRGHVLLPEGAVAQEVLCDGRAVEFESVQVEQSAYADFVLDGPVGGSVTIRYGRG